MRTRRKATIDDLRRAIDSLPRDTRVAMLDGIRQNDIIVGAYTDDGGICPMLAAFRAGGRASCISFAKAWDAFAFRGVRTRLARRATRRELLVLTAHLELSLLDGDGVHGDLGAAIAQHEELVRGRLADDCPVEMDRSAELQPPPRRVRLHDRRRYDEYERTPALAGGRHLSAVAANQIGSAGSGPACGPRGAGA